MWRKGVSNWDQQEGEWNVAFPGVRFFKFGMVGASGGVVNIVIIWLCREYLFSQIPWEGLRVNLSMVIAITISTANNYCWNRLWTWRDRKGQIGKGFWTQMAEYYVVCWVAIVLQIFFTNLLLPVMHYLSANIVSIAITAIVNFLGNDALTFSDHRMRFRGRHSMGRQREIP
jgi:putative flippase GtrA